MSMQLTRVWCAHVIPRLMMCKTVQATPQAGHSVVLESSSSSQGTSGLNGAARREMEVNGSIAGKKAADSNELERLFTQPNTQDTRMVSPWPVTFYWKNVVHCNLATFWGKCYLNWWNEVPLNQFTYAQSSQFISIRLRKQFHWLLIPSEKPIQQCEWAGNCYYY